MDKIIKLGAVKGNMLGVLNAYLNTLGLEPIPDKSRVLVHHRYTDKYQLSICLLRWEDIKLYHKCFDLILYGSDQWLESGHKAMIALQHLPQENCRLSLLVPSELQDRSLNYFKTRIIATGYPDMAKNYIGVSDSQILYMSGSVEAAIAMGWAQSIFDVVESGQTAKANGLVEYKTYVKFGAILATSKQEKIGLLEDLGLIHPLSKGVVIAFDGIDGCGKSTLSKHFVQTGVQNSSATVLVCPYSGYVGYEAKSLLDNAKVVDWAAMIGLNHWRAETNVNRIYDRNILTCMTELIQSNQDEATIKNVLDTWKPWPDVLFYCQPSLQTVLNRASLRKTKDEYDNFESLTKYYKLYSVAAEYLKNKTDIKIIELNTDASVDQTIIECEKYILETKSC